MSQRDPWSELADLLHDARLRRLEWDTLLARMTLVFDCLRRDPDGDPLPDPAVEFQLDGIRAILAGYESAVPGVRPSGYRPGRRITPADLRDWPFPPQEVYVAVNSLASEDDAVHAPRSEWLDGDLPPLRACRFRVGLTFSHTGMLGLPTNTVILLVGCEELTISSAGVPLDLDTWREQFRAGWSHWRPSRRRPGAGYRRPGPR
jgi:hypothetical protein